MTANVIHASALVRCPFSCAIEILERALRNRHDIIVSPMRGVRERVHVGWAIVDDLTDECRRHEALTIYWNPEHRTFPSFSGTLTVRPHFRDVNVRITGCYDPPAGGVGRLFDRMAGRHIARLTLRRLIRSLARDAESRYLVYLQEIRATGTYGHTGSERDEVLRTH
ncbi:MAG: hypothetical protein JO322_14515 [Candidatus Eremiobacteraeota bacterium]|nr:hypothetical protein [Candidatus Eremiobacteraeota bacterium]